MRGLVRHAAGRRIEADGNEHRLSDEDRGAVHLLFHAVEIGFQL